MTHHARNAAALLTLVLSTFACEVSQKSETTDTDSAKASAAAPTVAERMAKYTTVALIADTTTLTLTGLRSAR